MKSHDFKSETRNSSQAEPWKDLKLPTVRRAHLWAVLGILLHSLLSPLDLDLYSLWICGTDYLKDSRKFL